MTWQRGLLIAIAGLLGVWLTFDGTKAFVTGDYVTPRSGAYAGQLGPWSKVVAALGLEPRGAFVKSLHVALGLCWLASAVAFFGQPSIGWWLLLVCSVASLWYAPLGTALAIAELALLCTSSLRAFAS